MGGWARHWALVGNRSTGCGDADLETGRFADACRSYLAAAQYYWLALSESGLDVPDRRRIEDAHVGAFRTALPLLPHATMTLALQVDDISVAGYLFMPVGRTSASPTVLWPVGTEARRRVHETPVAMLLAGWRADQVTPDYPGRR